MKSTIRCYVDMDGVLADFDKHYESMFGLHPVQYEKERGTQKFWENIDKTEDFWIKIPPLPYLEEMWDFIADNFEHVMLISSPAATFRERCISQKRAWLDRYFEGLLVPAIFRKDKHVYAPGGALLIDDFHKNVTKWRDAGGVAIHHKSWEETKLELEKILKEST